MKCQRRENGFLAETACILRIYGTEEFSALISVKTVNCVM